MLRPWDPRDRLSAIIALSMGPTPPPLRSLLGAVSTQYPQRRATLVPPGAAAAASLALHPHLGPTLPALGDSGGELADPVPAHHRGSGSGYRPTPPISTRGNMSGATRSMPTSRTSPRTISPPWKAPWSALSYYPRGAVASRSGRPHGRPGPVTYVIVVRREPIINRSPQWPYYTSLTRATLGSYKQRAHGG